MEQKNTSETGEVKIYEERHIEDYSAADSKAGDRNVKIESEIWDGINLKTILAFLVSHARFILSKMTMITDDATGNMRPTQRL